MTMSRESAMIRVRVQPGASRDEVIGWREGALRLRVTAPPLAGRANAAVVSLIARVAGLRPSAVSIAAGQRGRDKLVRVTGLTPAGFRERIGA
jgi:uncharacterized protein (TIGR00251 family)